MSEVPVDTWASCYDGSWAGLIVPEAFNHPAKFSRVLIQRIYQHATQEGWLVPGATVLDCFGGVSLGGIDAGLAGYQHIAVELEPRFHALAEANIALWQRRYGHLPQWVPPVCLQGDSRQLAHILREQVELVCSSPPYGVGTVHDAGQDGAKIRRQAGTRTPRGSYADGHMATDAYGPSPANLGNLPTGHIDCAISSPPYAEGCAHTGGADKHPEHITGGKTGVGLGYAVHVDAVVASPPYADRCANDNQRTLARDGLRQGHNEGDGTTYGQTPGQLGALPTGAVDAVVASPPYEGTAVAACEGNIGGSPGGRKASALTNVSGNIKGEGYGDADGQLGQRHGDTFWSAARTILEQVFAVLKPGGVAVWVVKSYCRDGKIVDFPGDWRRLCEHVGFVTLHEHHALLVDTHSEMGLFGEPVTMYHTERKSFFRRLHEKKRPDLAINHETVYCMMKPLSAAPLQPDEASLQLPRIDAAFGSPPYADSWHNPGTADWRERCRKAGMPEGQIQRYGNGASMNLNAQDYGSTPGQLGALPAGHLDCALASPPYNLPMSQDHNGSKGGTRGTTPSEAGAFVKYGSTPGQLEGLPQGALDMVLASPPYAESINAQCHGIDWSKAGPATGNRRRGVGTKHEATLRAQLAYGTTSGQLGTMPSGTPPTKGE